MGGRHERMLHEQPFPHRLGKHAQRYDHAQHTGEHDGVFHRALPLFRSHLVDEGREGGLCPRDRHRVDTVCDRIPKLLDFRPEQGYGDYRDHDEHAYENRVLGRPLPLLASELRLCCTPCAYCTLTDFGTPPSHEHHPASTFPF